jgi:hypothetical protein
MAHHLNHMDHGGREDALSDHYGLVDDGSAPAGFSHVPKLLSNESNQPIGLSAIVVAVALLSLAAMVGVRMRRRMQPIALAGSSEYGIDMSMSLATVSADNTLDLVSHCLESS